MLPILSLIVILGLFINSLVAQQLYPGNSMVGCNNTDAAENPSSYLYSCNGEKSFCQAYLIFRSQHKYNSVTTISNLTSASSAEIARINNVSKSAVFPHDKQVIVPVNCSCSGQYYQANTSYIVHNYDENYYTIANDTYQGLSTCDALVGENPYDVNNVDVGLNLTVPLRCACPTKNQTADGVKFVLTYVLGVIDILEQISEQFNVTPAILVDSNRLSGVDETIFPFTTLLIPLHNEPTSSQTIVHPSPVVPQPPYIPTTKKNVDTNRNKNSYKGIHIGLAIGSTLSVICCILFLLFSYHKRRKIDNGLEENERMKKLKLSDNILGKITNDDQMLKIYEFEELEAATESFTSQKRLSASVYRGVLRGKLMAIKKMSKDVKKDVHILQKLYHFNVITLCGACEWNTVYYLVYEFMENGSLKEWLQKDSNPEIKSWNFRIRIALDVASGLEYLHNFTYPAYIHTDLNSSNILLNGDLRAKITNFSFAKSANRIQTWNSSSRHCQGTKGYGAPEYAETGELTPKMDVYAFGVVLLELITGREAVFEQDGEEVFLSDMIQSFTDRENEANSAAVANIIDPRLQVRHPLGYIIDQTEVAIRLAKLSVSCLTPEVERRISMAEVVSSLSTIQLDMQNQDSLSID